MHAATDRTEPKLHPTWPLGEELSKPRWTTRLRRTFLVRQSERERLRTDIDALAVVGANYESGSWSTAQFRSLLDQARLHAGHGDIDSGYETLHIAERLSIFGMSDIDLKVRAISLQHEIDKKLSDSWRGGASIEMLKAARLLGCAKALENTEPCTDADRAVLRERRRAAVAEAISHKNTHDRNSHRKTNRLRRQVTVIGAFLLLQGAFIALGIAKGFINLTPESQENHLLLEGATLGLLGGTLSSAMFISGFDRALSFQEMESAWIISLARALIGCAASIPVYVIASAKLITVGGTGSAPMGILVLCFLAGFSERWFLHIIGKGKSANAEDGKSTTRSSEVS